jgi:GMP synthase-like glutamine amidotransferase
MRIHFLQHVPFEGPAYIGQWARRHGCSLSVTALFDQNLLPTTDDFDMLVVLGGPMGVHDTDEYAWLTPEKRFIAQCLAMHKPVLGICLGAQLIADVLEARVYQNQYREIGWHRVQRAAAVDATALAQTIPAEFQAFHWHGDTFDLPSGAVHLAQSQACPNQAFFLPPATIGLQFHLESSQASIEQLIHYCGHELVPAPYVQTADEIRKQADRISPSNQLMDAILFFLRGNASLGDADNA